MFCRNCGKEVGVAAVVCLSCGAALPPPFPPPVAWPMYPSDCVNASFPPKDPVLMAVLSGCCIAGLGQIVLGQTTKGVAILLASLVLGVLTMGVSIFITWPLGAIDAYLIAKKLREGRVVGQWECF